MKILFNAFRNTFNYKGKTNREEYLMFGAIFSIILIPAYIINLLFPTIYVASIVSIIFLPTTLALTIRRLHDTGRNGWWLLPPFLILCIIIYLLKIKPDSILVIPVFIIESMLSILLFYLVLQPSKEIPEE